jgi:hypothetical protein
MDVRIFQLKIPASAMFKLGSVSVLHTRVARLFQFDLLLLNE